jgi:hypothetical protein
MYQGQKVHLFRPSLGFLTEAQPRLKTGEDERHFLAEVHILFLDDRTNYKQKTSFVANLLNIPTDGATVASEKVRPKKSYFSSACDYVKLSFSLSIPKK